MKCGCDNRLVWVVLAGLTVTVFVHVGLPALTDLADSLPQPTPEEQAEIDAAVDLSFQWFKEWWWGFSHVLRASGPVDVACWYCIWSGPFCGGWRQF